MKIFQISESFDADKISAALAALDLPETTILLGIDMGATDIMNDDKPTEKKPRKKSTAVKDPVDSPIPILSVLGSTVKNEPAEMPAEIPTKPIPEPAPVEEILIVEEVIEEIISEEIPKTIIPFAEKTLDDLLNEIEGLKEDKQPEEPPFAEDIAGKPAPSDDLTLEKLAEEFVEKESLIPAAKSIGKIGKLKNILPFKKAKKEDTGMMGDLFSWVGIAANDDDAAMPGFLK